MRLLSELVCIGFLKYVLTSPTLLNLCQILLNYILLNSQPVYYEDLIKESLFNFQGAEGRRNLSFPYIGAAKYPFIGVCLHR